MGQHKRSAAAAVCPSLQQQLPPQSHRLHKFNLIENQFLPRDDQVTMGGWWRLADMVSVVVVEVAAEVIFRK